MLHGILNEVKGYSNQQHTLIALCGIGVYVLVCVWIVNTELVTANVNSYLNEILQTSHKNHTIKI